MSTFSDLLMRTEELERRMQLSESRQKKQLKLLSFSANNIVLPGNTSVDVAEFVNAAGGGQAVFFASFAAKNPYAVDITLQLLANGAVVSERVLPANLTKPFQFCVKKTIETQGAVTLAVRAVYSQQLTLTDAEFYVFGNGVQNKEK